MDDLTITFGDEIKSLGDGKFCGYLVRFSDATQTDLAGDYFPASCDFDLEPGETKSCAVYYDHGTDPTLKARKIGKAHMKSDEVGVWVEGVIHQRDAYEKAIVDLLGKKRLGLSSGTASHLVEREGGARAGKILSWPLGLDASITPTPCEPLNEAVPLKSYKSVSLKSLLAEIVAEESVEQSETPDAEQPQEQSASEAETPEAVKSADPDLILDALEALPLKTFLEAMGAVAGLTDRRLAWYAEQRETKQGRAISAENLSAMRDIHDGMKQHLSHLKDILDRHDPATSKPKAVTAQSAYLDYLSAASLGGTVSL